MKNETKCWSEGLQQETRDAIDEMRIYPDGKLHFKNCNNGYAFMTTQDLLARKFSLTNTQNGQVIDFKDAEELLNADWAVDYTQPFLRFDSNFGACNVTSLNPPSIVLLAKSCYLAPSIWTIVLFASSNSASR